MRNVMLYIALSAALGCGAATAQDYPSKPIRFILPFPPGGLDASSEQGSHLWDANDREPAAAAVLIAQADVPNTQYPNRPLRFILPFPPGGGTDTLARIVSQKLGENLGQTIVLDNRPGAGANIGAEIGAHSVPDGYTLTMGNVAHAINMTLYAKPGYDLITDFAPITLLASTPNILVVHPSVAAKSVQELIALAKANPGKLNYASSGSGSSAHLAAELFKSMAGVNLTHVPYKGGGPAVTSLVGGETVVGFATAPSVLQQIKSGRLRGLAVTTSKRTAAMPELPTIAESGVPNYDASTWYGALAPAKTAASIITRLHAEFVKIMKSTDILDRIAVLGYEASTDTPQEFAEYIKSEIAKWGKVVKATGIRAD
jgi:tripartite-type tricarboxylate transporter receptor subunit TctC